MSIFKRYSQVDFHCEKKSQVDKQCCRRSKRCCHRSKNMFTRMCVCVSACYVGGWSRTTHPQSKQTHPHTHRLKRLFDLRQLWLWAYVFALSLCVLPACAFLFVGLADCRSAWVSRGMPAEHRSVSLFIFVRSGAGQKAQEESAQRQTGRQTDAVSTY